MCVYMYMEYMYIIKTVHNIECSSCIHAHNDVVCSTADILPRSILIAPFSGCVYLLVALGDGTLHYYQMDADSGVHDNKNSV